ncbi:MAG: hypothetical protein HC883_04545 [Bdellovibrionaceae bacterium]|nr:hypothetical protein [Pseudobdellovibrionaceae bacterium]
MALGAQWRHLVREEQWPEFDIELEGPSQPTVISWREGQLHIADWKSEVEAAFLNGVFESRGMRGNLKLQAVDSQVTVIDHEGGLTLKGEKGRIELGRINGDVALNWLSGVLRGERLSGVIVLDMPSGNARLSGVKGKLKATGATSQWDVTASAQAISP